MLWQASISQTFPQSERGDLLARPNFGCAFVSSFRYRKLGRLHVEVCDRSV